ncbi:hypothetical protein HYC85_022103 [Camellia sinensis]|uniref:CBS domain-containing protein n=1 Tax=Camellia sinensis TaxID=4442 RepID=A0A7J7GNA7_CAMSI|nr:hypothetical protein HYC85_022103 [Camellia sinensis]
MAVAQLPSLYVQSTTKISIQSSKTFNQSPFAAMSSTGSEKQSSARAQVYPLERSCNKGTRSSAYCKSTGWVKSPLDARSSLRHDSARAPDPPLERTVKQCREMLDARIPRSSVTFPARAHLPIVESGEVIVLLDIAKCLYDAIARMERAAEKGKAIAAAVEGVEKQWGASIAGPNTFIKTLRDRMFRPFLSTIIPENSKIATVSPTDTVLMATKKMVEYGMSSAVVAVENKTRGILM